MKKVDSNWMLLGSHGNLELLIKSIEDRFYCGGAKVEAHPSEIEDNYFHIMINGKFNESMRILKKGKRFRFEGKEVLKQ